jgi:tRNA threonylcarbamoyladenosine biosynthesis protein TsaB
MSNILVFDASSSWCSVALSNHGTLYATAQLQPRKHAQLIMPMIEDVFQQAGIKAKDLDGIAFGKGPGSFTGLRIAISVAQGLSLATGAKLLGISSLKALAWQAMKSTGQDHILAIMNAHMGEVFYGAYSHKEGELDCVLEDSLAKPSQLNLNLLNQAGLSLLDWFGAGDGFQFDEELADSTHFLIGHDIDIAPIAESMMDLAIAAWEKGHFTSAEQQQPVYLRDTVAWKKLSEQPSILKSSNS